MADDEIRDNLGELGKTGQTSAAKVTTRRGSKATELNRLKSTCVFYIKAIEKIKNDISVEATFHSWSMYDVLERIKRIEQIEAHLTNISITLGCEFSSEDELVDDETYALIMSLKAKLSARVALFKRQNDALAPLVQVQPLQLEMPRTDATGNVPNTWGTFDGDYTQWKSFRDRWMLLHDNKDVKPIVKLQNLKTACTGAAESALGEWDLIEENYAKAWERLQAIFEDDYMHILQLMRKLNSLPFIKDASSQTIRSIIDTVNKHIYGLNRYMKLDDKHPYIVATVIELMGAEVYRSWESHRTSLAKTKAKALEKEANEAPTVNASKSGKFFPTWAELEEFLECEFSIRVHAEERDEATQSDKASSAMRYKWFKNSSMESKPVMTLTAEWNKISRGSIQNQNRKKAKRSHSNSSGVN